MLPLGHLSPSIVTPKHLRDQLLKIQAKIPHQLRLPSAAAVGLWQYKGSLGCVILMDGDNLLVLVSLPLLDRKSTFEVFTVINLLIPYPEKVVREGIVARYIVFNVARTGFIPELTLEAARECEANVLGACSSRRPIYVKSSHKLCILGLF